MTFNLTFNPDRAKQQYLARFEELWQPTLASANKNTFAGSVMAVVGFALLALDGWTGWIVVAGACYYLFYGLHGRLSYRDAKNSYTEQIDEAAAGFKEGGYEQTWELTDDYFTYTDYRQKTSLKWDFISGYTVINDYIMLFMDAKGLAFFTLDKMDVTAQDYEQSKHF